MTEKQHLPATERETVLVKDVDVEIIGGVTTLPLRSAEGFETSEEFEGVLDKASRPTGRGKLAHLRPNSEEFARRKQEEIDLEERPR